MDARRKHAVSVTTAGALLVVALSAIPTVAFAAVLNVQRVSTSSSGVQSTGGDTTRVSVSADGRYIAFESAATNLVAGDSNGHIDVFVKDTLTGVTTRVSTDSSGNQVSDGDSTNVAISGDGSYAAFQSAATTLVAGDTNAQSDVFLKDLQTGVTVRVSTDSAGVQAAGDSLYPSISYDGARVAFVSSAANLAALDTNGAADVFVKNTQTGAITLASSDSLGNPLGGVWPQPGSISGDGRYVAFTTSEDKLVVGDTNALQDIFRKDTQTGAVVRLNVDSAGNEAFHGTSDEPSLSGDGRYATFQSYADNLVADDTNFSSDVFVRDIDGGTTKRVSVSTAGVEGDNASLYAAISADGNHVSFSSMAENLVVDDNNGTQDVFLRTVDTSTTVRVSISAGGAQADQWSELSAVSSDGRFVAFSGPARNLVTGDTNGLGDAFRVTIGERPPVVVTEHYATSLTALTVSPSRPKHGTYATFSAQLAPAHATAVASTLTLYRQETKTVRKKVGGRYKRVKVRVWNRKATRTMVADSSGRLSYRYKPAKSGTWKMVVSYPGSSSYTAASASKTFKVR
jgi:hypothetical protein